MHARRWSGRFKIGALTALMVWLAAPASFGAWPPDPESTPEAALESLFNEVRRIALHDPMPTRRAWAWRALGNARDPQLTLLAVHGLQDQAPLVRVEVVARLSQKLRHRQADRGDLLIVARRDPDPNVRIAAAEVHDVMAGHPGGFAELVRGLGDECAAVRSASLLDLGGARLALPSVDAAVWFAATTGSYETQLTILKEGLPRGPAERRQMRVMLAQLGGSSDPDVRLAVATAEADFDRPAAAVRVLTDPDPYVRRHLFRVPAIDAEHNTYALSQAMLDDDPVVANAALEIAQADDRFEQVNLAALRRRAHDSDPARANAAMAIAWRAEARHAATTPNAPRSPVGDGFDDLFDLAVELGDGVTDRSDDQISDALIRLDWLLGRPDPKVRRAACTVAAEATRLIDRRTQPHIPAATARLWSRLWEALDDRDPLVRRTVAMQFAKAYRGREINPPLGEMLNEIVLRVYRSPDPELVKAVLLPYDAPVWTAEMAQAMQALAADPSLSSEERRALFERRLKAAPETIATTELLEWIDQDYDPQHEADNQRVVSLLVQRDAWPALAAVASATAVGRRDTAWRVFKWARAAGVAEPLLAEYAAELSPTMADLCVNEFAPAERLAFARRSPNLMAAVIATRRPQWGYMHDREHWDKEAMRAVVESGDPVIALTALPGMLKRASNGRADDPSPAWRSLVAIVEHLNVVERRVPANALAP